MEQRSRSQRSGSRYSHQMKVLEQKLLVTEVTDLIQWVKMVKTWSASNGRQGEDHGSDKEGKWSRKDDEGKLKEGQGSEREDQGSLNVNRDSQESGNMSHKSSNVSHLLSLREKLWSGVPSCGD